MHKDRTIGLAPTFDHASSLGRELSDFEKRARLETKDVRFGVNAFATKARSALYDSAGDKKPLTNIRAFIEVAKVTPKAANDWLHRLEMVSDEDVDNVFQRFPPGHLSETSMRFARSILDSNRKSLLTLRKR